ncbi:MAG: transcription termination/antitermination factor NusG [Clostridia bacterium]|nr:transcription termination/antitermination factor NusG [Clostridia bacterium]
MSDFNESIPEVRWYVAHTYSGYENKVKTNLEKIIENRGLHHLIHDVRIPVEITVENEGEEDEKEVESKVFPSYVLVKMLMTDESWHVVRNIRGVTGFVGPGSKPVPLTDEEVAAIGVETRVVELKYAVGDSVKIVAGPLTGFVGVVEEISDDKKKIKVIASMFGRETPVELDSDSVEVIE